MVIDTLGADVGKLVCDLGAVLSLEETRATRAVFKQGEAEPGFDDFSRVSSLEGVIRLEQVSWLSEMLAENRFTSHFQPIVYAGDTSRVYGQEALLRGTDRFGELVSPAVIFGQARNTEIWSEIELTSRMTSIFEAHRHGITSELFLNISPTAMVEPQYGFEKTIEAITRAGLSPARVVLEVLESDEIHDPRRLYNTMRPYREAGFRMALDDLGSGHASLNLIHLLRPDVLKLDMELIRNVHRDPYKALITQKLLEVARKIGITTVAEGIEVEEELAWVREHGVDFVQGFLVARPTAVPVTTTPKF